MKNKLLALFLLPAVAFAQIDPSSPLPGGASTGRIIRLYEEGNRFLFATGNFPLKVGEELLVRDEVRNEIGRAKIIKIEHSVAEAVMLENKQAQLGHEVQILSVHPTAGFSFFVGPNWTPKKGPYGGTNWSLGLVIDFWTSDHTFLILHLQAQELGKDSTKVGERIGSYMFGGGYARKGFFGYGALGVNDFMTIAPDASVSTTFDPITGGTKTISKGVNHVNKFGWLISTGYKFRFREVTPESRWGWYLGPLLTVNGDFSKTGFAPRVGMHVNIGMNRFFEE